MSHPIIRVFRFIALPALLVPLICSAIPANDIVVTYGPVPASVPTLSQWGMLFTCALLAVCALMAVRLKEVGHAQTNVLSLVRSTFAARNANRSKPVLLVIVMAAVVYAPFFGHAFIGEVHASPAGLTEPGGGNFGLPLNAGVISVQNTTQVPLVIISVTPDGARNSVNTTCKPGTVVQPLATCNVDTAFVPG